MKKGRKIAVEGVKMSVFRLLLALAALAGVVAQLRASPNLDKYHIESTGSFDWDTSNIAHVLSAAAYCETKSYQSLAYPSYASGFKALYTVDDSRTDTQGFVGVMASTKQIYAVYRGSESIQDWVNDLEGVVLSKYGNDACNCYVHSGIYSAYTQTSSTIISYLKKAMASYPGYEVIISGHSLGAALASFLSLQLNEEGITNRLFNYGCPRLGDTAFADYASTVLKTKYRVTHHKDMVPHAPTHIRYTHYSGEWYEEQMSVKECSGEEDSTCSYQWNITSIDDHMCYFNLYMDCYGIDGSKTCTSS